MSKLARYQKTIIITTASICALSLTAAGVDKIVSPSISQPTLNPAMNYSPGYVVPFPSYPAGEYAPTVAPDTVFQCIANGNVYEEQIVSLSYTENPVNLHKFTNLQECDNQVALDQWGTS